MEIFSIKQKQLQMIIKVFIVILVLIAINNLIKPYTIQKQAKIKKMIKLQNRTEVEQQRHDKQVFDTDFTVESMVNPMDYLPQYQKNVQYQTSCIQDCQVGCGNICILCAYPFGCCGCTNCCCCYQLPTSQVGLVQSFGRFSKLLKPGLNMINPCSEEVKQVRTLDMRINVLNLGKNITMTKDNVKLTIDASVAYRVTNPVIAFYVLGNNLNRALHQSATSSIRQIVADYTLDKLLISRLQLSTKSKDNVTKMLPPGILVENIFIEEIIVPLQIQRDLTAAARQKRISEANIINSKANVETASLMKQSAELLDTKAAMQIRYLQMVQELGKRGVVLMMGIGVDKKGF